MQYQKRLKGDPLWITMVVGGINQKTGESFLGTTNFHGTRVEIDDYVVTGLGNYYSPAVMENNWKADMSEAEARSLIEQAMRMMFFRDKKAYNKFQIATVTKDGVNIGEPYEIEAFKEFEFHHVRTNEFFRPMRSTNNFVGH